MTSEINADSPMTDQQTFNIVSTIIVSVMMACVAVTVVLFGSKVIPEWQAAYLPGLCFLIALERMTTLKKTGRLLVFSKSWLVYHLTQWVFILIVLKVIQVIINHPDSLWREIQLWRIDLFTYFFTKEYILSIILILVIWSISGYYAYLLEEMSLEESLIRYETAVVAPVSIPPARERLLAIFFAMGFLMVILTALMRVNMRMLIMGNFNDLQVQPLPYLAAGAWNVLLYFLLGLVLMSQSQFARLNARWHFQKIQITPRLAARWATYSILFIAFLAVVASILPTNYSLGFLSSLSYVLKYIAGILFIIFSFVWSVVIFLFNLILSLLGIAPRSEMSMPVTDFTPPEPPVETPQAAVYPWLEVIKSLLFWVVFLSVIGFSVFQFLRQHEAFLEAIRHAPGVSWLSRFFRWLVGGFKGINQRVSQVVESGLQRLRARRGVQIAREISRYLSLRQLSPRQRVYFFFLAMVRRGGERGVPRRETQTPYEYADLLETKIPEVDQDIVSIAEAFVEARYSRREINDEKAGLVKRYWEHIRKALRSFSK